jgi:hypothetical protein
MLEQLAAVGSVAAIVFAILRLRSHLRRRDLSKTEHVRVFIDPPEPQRDVILAPHDIKSVETLISEVSLPSARTGDKDSGAE